MKGFFITLEGIDGCGKTTQMGKIVEYIKNNGFDVVTAREPGGTELSEKIREVLLDIKNKGMNPVTELLLYAAARAELVSSVILPAVNKGKIVVCDRFVDSSIAYQGFGRDLGIKMVENINQYALQGCKPDITFFFDISPEEVLDRKNEIEQGDRIELEAIEFHNKVYRGYLEIANREKDRIKIINSRKPIDEVFKEVKVYLDVLLWDKNREIGEKG